MRQQTKYSETDTTMFRSRHLWLPTQTIALSISFKLGESKNSLVN